MIQDIDEFVQNETLEEPILELEEIDYLNIDSSKYDVLPPFYSPELIQRIPSILIKIFGRKFPLEFYSQKARELAYLFGGLEDFADTTQFIFESDLEDLTIEEPPLRDFSALGELRQALAEIDWEVTTIADALYRISLLDSRHAVALAYCFGLMPQFNGLRSFYSGLGVSRQIIDTFAVNGMLQLRDSIQQENEIGIFPTVLHVRKFLKDLSDYDSKYLIKFSDEKLVGYKSATYKLAQMVIDGVDIEREHLSASQRNILKIFKRVYKRTGLFPTYEEIAQQLDLAEVTIYKHIERILQVVESEGNYYRTVNGKAMEVEEGGTLNRIFEILDKHPDAVSNINLSELQKQILNLLVELRTEATYPGIGIIAQRLELSRRRVIELITSAIDAINSETPLYYENDYRQLPSRDIRVQVIKLGGIEYIRALNIRECNKRLIEFLLELKPGTHTFKYTVTQVAFLVGTKTNNPGGSIYDVVKAIINGENDYNLALADRRGVALTRNHLIVVELLQKKGLACLQDIKPEWNYQLAEMLLQTDEHGRYYEYEYIEQQLGYVSSAISEGVKRIIAWLGEV